MASYLEGVEESGQAPANRANGGELLAPALSTQKEIGIKAVVAEGILLQLAAFDIKRASTTVDSANRFVFNGMAEYGVLNWRRPVKSPSNCRSSHPPCSWTPGN